MEEKASEGATPAKVATYQSPYQGLPSPYLAQTVMAAAVDNLENVAVGNQTVDAGESRKEEVQNPRMEIGGGAYVAASEQLVDAVTAVGPAAADWLQEGGEEEVEAEVEEAVAAPAVPYLVVLLQFE